MSGDTPGGNSQTTVHVRDSLGPVIGDNAQVHQTFVMGDATRVNAYGTTADMVAALGRHLTGATKKELAAADQSEPEDPEQALEHVRAARQRLEDAGFPAHAAVLDDRIVGLLSRLGRHSEAARMLLDRFWLTIAESDTHAATGLGDTLRRLATETEAEGQEPLVSIVEDAAMTAAAAVKMLVDPYGRPPAWDTLPESTPDPRDRSRLLLLAAEVALGEPDADWIDAHGAELEAAAADAANAGADDIAVRLHLALADAHGQWDELVRDARQAQPSRPLGALILARHGRYLAINGFYREADDAWSEAIQQACLAGHNIDAADWVYSRRVLNTRYQGWQKDHYQPLAQALDQMPGNTTIVSRSSRRREQVMEALKDGKHREAALRLHPLLRTALVSGSWREEHDARLLLAELYTATGDLQQAVHQLVQCGQAKQARKLASTARDTYLDISSHLNARTYWVQAAAWQVTAAQADLVPDDDVDRLAGKALTVLEAAAAGTLVDTPFFEPSLYRSALDALATLADRVRLDQASRLLELLQPYIDAEPNSSYYIDKAHALAAGCIGARHPSLCQRALDHLSGLFLRASHDVPAPARDLMIANFSLVEERLRSAEATSSDAKALLAVAAPERISGTQIDEAAANLTAPLTNTAGVTGFGTGAIRASAIAQFADPHRRTELVEVQLQRARSPYEPGVNRIEYLTAAAHLAVELAPSDADRLFPQALALTKDHVDSYADQALGGLNHPLSAFRAGLDHDSRPMAVLLAATLARTPEQRDAARAAALAYIAIDGADVTAARALQTLDHELERDVHMLASLGWAPRSLAAIVWARSPDLPADLGDRLAVDSDQRVRRTLARELARYQPDERTAPARSTLGHDPRHSVRVELRARGAN